VTDLRAVRPDAVQKRGSGSTLTTLEWMEGLAATLDGVLARGCGRLFRVDLDIPVDERDEPYLKAVAGAWLALTGGLVVLALLLTPRDSWAAAALAALVLTVPAGMSLLRGIHDIARARYTAGGAPVAVALLVAFAGALAALQPVR
jgi:hypothetical protein